METFKVRLEQVEENWMQLLTLEISLATFIKKPLTKDIRRDRAKKKMKNYFRSALLGLFLTVTGCDNPPEYRSDPGSSRTVCEDSASEAPNCREGYSIDVSCGYENSGTKKLECIDGELVEGPCIEETFPAECPTIEDPIGGDGGSSDCLTIECVESTTEYRSVVGCGLNSRGTTIEERVRECLEGSFGAWVIGEQLFLVLILIGVWMVLQEPMLLPIVE